MSRGGSVDQWSQIRITSMRSRFRIRIKVKSRIRIRNPVCNSVADPDPGSGIGYLFDPWIRDPEWEKVSIRIRDSG